MKYKPSPHDGKDKIASIYNGVYTPLIKANPRMYMSNQSAMVGVLPCRETPFSRLAGKSYVDNNVSVGRPNLGYARGHVKGGVGYNPDMHPVSVPLLKPVSNHNKAILSQL
eukprot:6213079-Pleurochrysis_carterae.AAC.2